jgi:hypothetical protein
MRPIVRGLVLAVLCTSALWSEARPADASVYWFLGVRGSQISVCFVGDAVTKRPGRVREVVSDIQQYEYAGNVHWLTVGADPLATAAAHHIGSLACPPSSKLPNGNDYFKGDIRVVLSGINVPGTGRTPGKGCTMFRKPDGTYNGKNNSWGSFSNSPDDLPKNRSCIYNLKLGDDPWPKNGVATGNPPSTHPYINHTLHEFGHALGLAHEHQRNDVDPRCTAKGYGGGLINGHITPYDRYSVMNYQFLSCGINGNYDNTGLSAWDQLGIHIMYPEHLRVADIAGATVVRLPDALQLESAWQWAGANMDFVAHSYAWKLNGKTVSTSPVLIVHLSSAGDYTLEFSYTDFLGRTYTYTDTVRALDSAQYLEQAAATMAGASSLMT